MKTFVHAFNFLALLSLSTASLAVVAQQSVIPSASAPEVAYDKFSDKTEVRARVHLADCADVKDLVPHVDMIIMYNYAGQNPQPPTTVVIAVSFYERHFSGTPEIIILADGQRLRLGNMTVNNEAYNVGNRAFFWQLLTVQIPFKTFLTMAQAKEIEMKIGDTEFAPPTIDRKAIQAVLPVFRQMAQKVVRIDSP